MFAAWNTFGFGILKCIDSTPHTLFTPKYAISARNGCRVRFPRFPIFMRICDVCTEEHIAAMRLFKQNINSEQGWGGEPSTLIRYGTVRSKRRRIRKLWATDFGDCGECIYMVARGSCGFKQILRKGRWVARIDYGQVSSAKRKK